MVVYASGDRREALDLVTRLEAEGVRVWVSPRDLDPTRGTADQINGAIRGASAIVLILSEAANSSQVLKTEAEVAVGFAPIVPVRIAEMVPAQALRSLVQAQPVYDLFGARAAEGFAQLAVATRALQGARGHRKPEPSAPTAMPWDEPEPAPPPALAPLDPEPIGDGGVAELVAPVAVAAPVVAPPMVAPIPAETAFHAAPLGRNAAQRHFVGPSATRYVERWRRIDARDNATYPFVAGLLFGRAWFAWRKLRLAAGLSSLIAIGLFAFAFWAHAHGQRYGILVLAGGLLLIQLVPYLRGVALYQTRADRIIDHYNEPGLDMWDAADALRRRGGTSPLDVAVLLAVEVAAVIALAWFLDPALVTRLTARDAPMAEPKLELVDMHPKLDRRARYTFCLVNTTDYVVNFTLRYGNEPATAQALPSHSKAFTFWSRDADAPTVSFDHILNDGNNFTERSYGLDTARTDDQAKCGGIVYAFVQSDNDLDLKRKEDAGAM